MRVDPLTLLNTGLLLCFYIAVLLLIKYNNWSTFPTTAYSTPRAFPEFILPTPLKLSPPGREWRCGFPCIWTSWLASAHFFQVGKWSRRRRRSEPSDELLNVPAVICDKHSHMWCDHTIYLYICSPSPDFHRLKVAKYIACWVGLSANLGYIKSDVPYGCTLDCVDASCSALRVFSAGHNETQMSEEWTQCNSCRTHWKLGF